MSPIQQMLLGGGAVATKKYIEDAFLTYVYANNNGTQTTNFDLTESGGLLWIKNRSESKNHVLNDTVRGATKMLMTNEDKEEEVSSGRISGITSTGFTLGSDNEVRDSSSKYVAWNFAIKPGFFTCLTYSGNDTNRLIAHDLGSVPGLIIVKRRDDGGHDWRVLYRGSDGIDTLRLNRSNTPIQSSASWNSTLPTATHFSLGSHSDVNDVSGTYVAYLFAGGASAAATAKSVDFDGNDYLSLASSADLAPGTGNFTWEAWIKPDDWDQTYMPLFVNGSAGGLWIGKLSSNFAVHAYNGSTQLTYGTFPSIGTWTHVAVTRSGTTLKLFYNGLEVKSVTSSQDFIAATTYIGNDTSTNYFDGRISNVRFVKGTAVYTSTFIPPTEPLTNITNTKLLCCNDSSNTGSTVTPGTITAHGDLAPSKDSPFDDTAGFVFGENEDQGVIKCGTYFGNSSTDGPEVYLGWEPQWVMIKNLDTAKPWCIHDMMRGFWNNGTSDDISSFANLQNADLAFGVGEFTSTGFKLRTTDSNWNNDGDEYIYICIRRPDGYVSKLPEVGTDIFNVIAGTSGDPTFKTQFVTDFISARPDDSASSWWTYFRPTGTNYLAFNSSSGSGAGGASKRLDFMNGFTTGGSTNDTAWGWKRYAGMDLVCYSGNSNNRDIRHSMGIAPTMVWLKNTTGSEGWVVGSSELSSWAEYLTLNNNDGESTNAGLFNSKAPTATHFSLGTQNRSNETNQDYIAILFASVSGISSVGSYTGNGQTGSSGTFVTTGFQPRLVWVKRFDGHGQDWPIYDSHRGFDADTLYLNENNAADAVSTAVEVSSTGFRLITNNANTNNNTDEYIYYAHA